MSDPLFIVITFAVVLLALYVMLVAGMYMYRLGFAVAPIFLLAFFGLVSILLAVGYNRRDDLNFDGNLAVLTGALVVVFILGVSISWFIYTQYAGDKTFIKEDLPETGPMKDLNKSGHDEHYDD